MKFGSGEAGGVGDYVCVREFVKSLVENGFLSGAVVQEAGGDTWAANLRWGDASKRLAVLIYGGREVDWENPDEVQRACALIGYAMILHRVCGVDLDITTAWMQHRIELGHENAMVAMGSALALDITSLMVARAGVEEVLGRGAGGVDAAAGASGAIQGDGEQ